MTNLPKRLETNNVHWKLIMRSHLVTEIKQMAIYFKNVLKFLYDSIGSIDALIQAFNFKNI